MVCLSIPTPKKIKSFITVCLRRAAGEILPDKIAIEELNDDKFGQLMLWEIKLFTYWLFSSWFTLELNQRYDFCQLYDCHWHKSDDCKSGWIVTFLMIVRGGGPSSGYVSTGIFGGKYLIIPLFPCLLNFFFSLGLTLGRVVLVEVTKKVIFYIVFTISGRSHVRFTDQNG